MYLNYLVFMFNERWWLLSSTVAIYKGIEIGNKYLTLLIF